MANLVFDAKCDLCSRKLSEGDRAYAIFSGRVAGGNRDVMIYSGSCRINGDKKTKVLVCENCWEGIK